VPHTETKRRVPAVKPDERQEMLVRAVLPLVVEHAAVTTARVAGIGEGTIFRAFADKDELLEALRPDSALELIAEIPLHQPLAARPVEAAGALSAHLAELFAPDEDRLRLPPSKSARCFCLCCSPDPEMMARRARMLKRWSMCSRTGR
jgi:hypothetical protein